MRRIAFVLALLVCVACDDDKIRIDLPKPDGGGIIPSLDSGLPAFDGGMSDGSMVQPGDDAHVPGNDGSIVGPGRKQASVVSVPPTYAIAEEPYKYTVKANVSGETMVKVKGPDGMDSDGANVAWEPSKGQAGDSKVTVQTKIKDDTVDQDYTVTVVAPQKQAEGAVDKNGGQVVVSAPNSKARGAGACITSGALEGATTVTISEVKKSPAKHGTQGQTTAVHFGPKGTSFSRAVNLTLPLPDGVVLDKKKIGAYVYNPRGQWERVQVVAVDLVNHFLTAHAHHFSLYAAAQSGYEFDAALERMASDSFCPGELVARAELTSALTDIPAESINNLSSELAATAAADELSIQDLIQVDTFQGSLRSVSVFELVDADGQTVDTEAIVTTLYVSETGKATVTHTDPLGNVLGSVSYASLADGLTDVAQRLLGAADVVSFGALELDSATLAVGVHFIYDPQDLSVEALDLADIGLAAAELPAGEVAEIPLAESPADVDCDGLAGAFDATDNRALPGILAIPSEISSILVGGYTTLHAEVVRGPDNSTLSWEVLDDAPGTLQPGDGDNDRAFTASEPGRYYVRAFGSVSGEQLSTVFVIDVSAIPLNMQLPTCDPTAVSTVVKAGESVTLSATLGESNVPEEAVSIEWGLVYPDADPNALVSSPELTPIGDHALLAPAGSGDYNIGCRTVLGDAASAIGTLRISALPADANLLPVDLTLFPLSVTVNTGEPVNLSASASDKESATLNFHWSSSGGALSGQQDQAQSSSIAFASSAEGVFTVEVDIDDGESAAQALTATVVVLDHVLSNVDADGDGWPAGDGPVGDCNDANADIHPTAVDVCGNQIDEDCDGVARNDDCDGDGVLAESGDCDDQNPYIGPKVTELCDGIDNNCNQQIDETFGVDGTCTVGIGVCATTGELSCSADGQYALCNGTPGTGTPEICDQLDNDCNGQVDDGNVCPVCVPTAQFDTTCDNVDDDCDGSVDEEFSQLTTCGQGVCAATGKASCVAGQVQNNCTPGTGTSTDSACNNLDDDCDGQVDEDFITTPTSCGQGACQAAGTTTCVAGSLGDTCVAGTPAQADTTCDGKDDDCDGAVDDDFAGTPTSCGQGVCQASGVTTCSNGTPGNSCVAGQPSAQTDTTCDGKDDDCDGAVDDDFAGTPTSCGQGVCQASGVTTCSNGTPGNSCVAGQPSAQTDTTCDGKDDDCDGTADDDFASAPTSCGVGACQASGATTCVNGTPGNSCAAGTPAANDTLCDGVDNDCDGNTDEDFVPAPTSCGVGACQAAGATTCIAGKPGDSCAAGTPAASDTLCDGVDNDCDGNTDEDFVPAPTSCGVGACQAAGATTCIAGKPGNSCAAGTPAANDTLCDGVDNDCDGNTDEDFVPAPTSCGLGACQAAGATTCVNGTPGNSCAAGTPAANDTLCDGVDNDCDGNTDEDFVPAPTSCGVGACQAAGATTCVNGTPGNSCVPGAAFPNDTLCNGVDDDCDGNTDEDFIPLPTNCGVGACMSSGDTFCSNGKVGDTCTPNIGQSEDVTCNGVDDDCDGTADEDYVSTAITCGVGACQGSGMLTCENGVEVNGCVAHEGAPVDASCDGIDDDCDGIADDDFVPSTTFCGTGACSAQGTLGCSNGTPIDSCAPGLATEDDSQCNGIDDDCDGDTDEDFPVTDTSCGQGVCAGTGTLSCVAGAPTDSCVIGTPNSDLDNDCNNFDDDCDGSIDDDFVSQETSCGTGACASTGITSCAAGFVSDSCFAGTPQTDVDTSCNGVDDDCDGTIDDDFVSDNCIQEGAFGACQNGFLVCSDGVFCQPSAPQLETCNGLDDDCDGFVDNINGSSCSTGLGGLCDSGHQVCSGSEVICTADTVSSETCNGEDDDCDGIVDNGPPEVCDGVDNNCNEAIDENGVCGCSPSSEICDGLDNDCDEVIDNVTGECSTKELGVCDAGHFICGKANDLLCVRNQEPNPTENCEDGVDDDCDGSVDANDTDCGGSGCIPSSEVCDTIDNDCDGLVDNVTGDCHTNLPGVCGDGHFECDSDHLLACVQNNPPGVEDCGNGLDDDCDSAVDDQDTECGGAGCKPSEEVCNGLDDDCNGLVDDIGGECNTEQPGVCGPGHFECDPNFNQICVANEKAQPESEFCTDQLDNDCDGLVDFEDSNDCRGECVPNGGEVCNGVDDDCNGVTDDIPPGACPTGQPGICSAGHFECNVDFNQTCVPDQKPQLEADFCADSLDNDCDGLTDANDDDCRPACVPNGPEICNGIDDDCNGSVDDNCVLPGESCTTAQVITPGVITSTLQGYRNDDIFPCTPGAPDRWYQITLPPGGPYMVNVQFSGPAPLPQNWALRRGPCSSQTQMSCGLTPVNNVAPGTYFIVVEGAAGQNFTMNVMANLP